MTKLKETFETHGLELRNDKCTAYCPTPERTADIREEMTQFVKLTTSVFMILGMASDGEYRTEITTAIWKTKNPRVTG